MNKRTLTLLLALLLIGWVWRKLRPAQPLAYKANHDAPIPARLQHAVFYVRDLERSRQFYQELFDLQFSARNHPDSSAAMRLVGQSMMFFSFGEMHHDICFVLNPSVPVDNEAWLGFTAALRNGQPLTATEERLNAMDVAFTHGRALPVSADTRPALFFRDPDGHLVEVVEAAHG